MAATGEPVFALLSTLTESLTSSATAFPANTQLHLPSDGISLLDVKNDLLLSYLQHIVFLLLLKIRRGSQDERDDESTQLGADAIKKLVELRVYLDRGVRPLEGRLKYQIDKVLRAAEDAERVAARTPQKGDAVDGKRRKPRTGSQENLSASDSDSDASQAEPEINDLSYRPNPAALLRKPQTNGSRSSTTKAPSGAYKPPRINPTSMPLPPSTNDQSRPARARKSALLDEYIDDELSTAPRAQPSIGSNSTILNNGRSGISSRDRERERERTEYEERNFTRLPAESKAEKRKAKLRGERDGGRRDMFGGEDWTGLGGLGDRVHRSVSGMERRDRDGRMSVLERREKRERDGQEGQRGDGRTDGNVAIGDAFEKRRKVVQGRVDRKKGGKRR